MGEREGGGHKGMEVESETNDRKEGRIEMERENDGCGWTEGEDDVGKIYEDKKEIETRVVFGGEQGMGEEMGKNERGGTGVRGIERAMEEGAE
jgi:hypothetical protein